MKKTIILILITISATLNAQDSSKKKDSVLIPVYVYDKLDTVKLDVLLYEDDKGYARVTRPGYLIYSGKVVQGKDGKMQWVEQPKVIGAFDNRKRKVKNL